MLQIMHGLSRSPGVTGRSLSRLQSGGQVRLNIAQVVAIGREFELSRGHVCSRQVKMNRVVAVAMIIIGRLVIDVVLQYFAGPCVFFVKSSKSFDPGIS